MRRDRLKPDLILYDANVLTMDPILPKAQTVAIRGGKTLAAGGNEDFDDLLCMNTQVIDCKGKTILPGFIDAHCHLRAYAERFVTLDISPRNHVYSISDLQARIRSFSEKVSPGTWIIGKAYDEFYLREQRHPTHRDLDASTSLHPVKLTHRTGHAHVLNKSALAILGISRETPDPPGGMIDRDIETGEPTGILYGMGDYLAKNIPPLTDDQIRPGVERVTQELLASGVTSVQDATSRNDLNQWRMFCSWKKSGLLRPRVTLMLGMEGFEEYRNDLFSFPVDANDLRIGGVKIVLHETTGQLAPTQEELNEMVYLIHESGLQAILHAIEESTIEAACSAIDRALKKSPQSDHRHRIEHCSVCPPGLAKRIAALGIMVVTQPSFIYYNGERYLKTVPKKQLSHLYPLATLLRNDVRVAASSDFPLTPPTPLCGIYAAVSRIAENGEAIVPREGVSPSEALRMYTLEGARSIFEERVKGSITPGKLADLVVLSGDPTKVPINEIKEIKVEMTILGGEVVWNQMS